MKIKTFSFVNKPTPDIDETINNFIKGKRIEDIKTQFIPGNSFSSDRHIVTVTYDTSGRKTG